MTKTCGVCQFEFNAYRQKMRFCSRKCGVRGRSGPTRRAASTNNARCGFCGTSLYRKPHALKITAVHYCNRGCKASHQKLRMTGDANHNYRDAGWKTCEGCARPFKAYNSNRRFCGFGCSQVLTKNEYLLNARRGLEAEQWCAAELRKQGYQVFRSMASRGSYDVIAMNDDEALLISVKRTKSFARRSTPKAIQELKAATHPAAGPFRKQLWCWVDNRKWTITDV